MKSVRLRVLASAVGAGIAAFGIGATASAAAISAAASAQPAISESPVGRYILTFGEEGLASYRGSVPGLAPTAPSRDFVSANASRKIDARSSDAVAYRDFLRAQRAQHVATIEHVLGRPLSIRYTYEITRNAVSVDLSAAEAAAVATMPGVVSVEPVTVEELQTFRGPEFIGADAIWNGTGVPAYASATRGEGVRVGIIDSGSYVGHPSFANDATCGFTAARPKLHAKDCMTNNGSQCTGSTPDADPGNGHGVHTASTVAGNTIDNTVTPAPLLPDGTTMSGVAPCAEVYSYKVCDSNGCTSDAITAAIQNAVVDQVDVINYSIGPTCGGGNPWTSNADFLTAMGADVFVAASAGNTRANCTNPIGLVSNNGPWITTVAASTQDKAISPLLHVTGPGTPPAAIQHIPLNPGSTTLKPAQTVNVSGVPLRTYPTNKTGCTTSGGIPAGYYGPSDIAILRRGDCNFAEKITNASNSGARTIVITNNQAGGINMNTTGAPTNVAAFSVSDMTVGDALIAFVDANLPPPNNVDIIFQNGFETPAVTGAKGDYERAGLSDRQGDVLADFSFRGPTPAPYENLTKPDITGPGVDIFAGLSASEGSYGLSSGTSMSSPHVAGSGALVRAVRPSWSPMEVKSALQTTAKTTGFREDGTTAWTVDQVGSGRVDLTKAALAGLTLDETPERFQQANPTGGTIDMRTLNVASMRNVACGTSCTWTRTVKNRLNVSGTWNATAQNPAGYTLAVTPATFTLAPGFSQTITVTATATNGAPTNISYGQVDLKEANTRSPDQHLTVAVRGALPPPGDVCQNGNCVLKLDNLVTNFTGIGCASYCGLVWLNAFQVNPGEYPITIRKILTIFGANTGWNAAGDKINFYVYVDADNNPANGATLAGSYRGYAMPAPANAWVTITLPTPIVVNGPGDLIIALTNPTGNTGLRPASADQGPFAGRSWLGDYADTPAGVAPDLAAPGVGLVLNTAAISGFNGNWLIRAEGTNAGGEPVSFGGPQVD